MDRRTFLRGLGFGSAALLTSGSGFFSERGAALAGNQVTIAGSQAPFNHVVLVMMENRSFDHLLGWLPGADGKQAGLTYVDALGTSHPTYSLAPDYTGCPHSDPDHSYGGGRIQYDGGKMDGFLRSGQNDVFCIGYYDEPSLPFYNALARNYTAFDRYFCSILGPTFPNRIFQHAAQTDRLSNTFDISSLPTIWDSLQQAGITAHYYFSDVPFLALWGAKYIPISASYQQFLGDCATGKLPSFSFVDPRYTVTDDGTGNDDHPHADMRAGEAFMAEIYHAVTSSPLWPRTVLIYTFDEWGGFFDHVAPPRAAAANGVDTDIVNGEVLLGLRIPPVVVSPFTYNANPNKPRVIHHVFDHTSVLKLLEWRWNLKPLTARDASSAITNLNVALNFQNPQMVLPSLPEPMSFVPLPCPEGTQQTFTDTFGSEESVEIPGLQKLAVSNGWPIY